MSNADILADLARAKAAFQLRALTAIITNDLPATTTNPSVVADSRGARPSGRTEGHAPAASLNHALHGFSEGGLSAALFDPFHSTASSPEA